MLAKVCKCLPKHHRNSAYCHEQSHKQNSYSRKNLTAWFSLGCYNVYYLRNIPAVPCWHRCKCLLKQSRRCPVVSADVFQKALSGGVSNISFSTLSTDLGRTMYKYSFRIPPYYTLLVRSLSVLEGIALASDPNYKVCAGFVSIPSPDCACFLMTSLALVVGLEQLAQLLCFVGAVTL